MPSARNKILEPVTVADFLAWEGDGSGRKFQLVDGELRAMSPAHITHGRIQSKLDRLIGNCLEKQGGPCEIVTEPAVATRVRANINLRVPDLGVTCTPDAVEQETIPDPLVLIEILSPGNASKTWENVWSYTTIPSVREILVVHSTRRFAELLRRDADGNWPAEPEEVGPDGALRLDSIAFTCPLPAIYAQTHLA
jgi:Uma2 family endonuclease